jgi:hypothetical protein
MNIKNPLVVLQPFFKRLIKTFDYTFIKSVSQVLKSNNNI